MGINNLSITAPHIHKHQSLEVPLYVQIQLRYLQQNNHGRGIWLIYCTSEVHKKSFYTSKFDQADEKYGIFTFFVLTA